jgi:hypothetical protein
MYRKWAYFILRNISPEEYSSLPVALLILVALTTTGLRYTKTVSGSGVI